MDGMANPGERSINIVKENKPKVLAGLGQKGSNSRRAAKPSNHRDILVAFS
jgi:hypothetical protein